MSVQLPIESYRVAEALVLIIIIDNSPPNLLATSNVQENYETKRNAWAEKA